MYMLQNNMEETVRLRKRKTNKINLKIKKNLPLIFALIIDIIIIICGSKYYS